MTSSALGFTLALTSSASNAAAGATQKAVTQQLPSPQGALALQAGLTALTFAIAFSFQDDASEAVVKTFETRDFLVAWILSGSINIIASLLYQLGLKKGDLGDTLPFLSLTPAFLLAFERVVLNQTVSANGALGVATVSLGGFLLARNSSSTVGTVSVENGQKSLKKSRFSMPPGSGIFTVIAALYSISSAYDKLGVQVAPPLLYGATIQATVSAGAVVSLIIGGFMEASVHQKTASCTGKTGLTTGRHLMLVFVWWGFHIVAYWSQLKANQLIAASYLSAIRRAGSIFGLLLGRIIFKEQIRSKLLPVFVMVLGVCLLSMK
eukprot:TRINITY_DN1291_c1_g1_i1.p1 TRINITY_DN1291_c1_g1~~TRINITY_DN1291_c1_g1_i1.p1  ORF type:complete len:322 (-),score=25.45 TRINITY_DN1291_c1_g1_i1:339-1304(-)